LKKKQEKERPKKRPRGSSRSLSPQSDRPPDPKKEKRSQTASGVGGPQFLTYPVSAEGGQMADYIDKWSAVKGLNARKYAYELYTQLEVAIWLQFNLLDNKGLAKHVKNTIEGTIIRYRVDRWLIRLVYHLFGKDKEAEPDRSLTRSDAYDHMVKFEKVEKLERSKPYKLYSHDMLPWTMFAFNVDRQPKWTGEFTEQMKRDFIKFNNDWYRKIQDKKQKRSLSVGSLSRHSESGKSRLDSDHDLHEDNAENDDSDAISNRTRSRQSRNQSLGGDSATAQGKGKTDSDKDRGQPKPPTLVGGLTVKKAATVKQGKSFSESIAGIQKVPTTLASHDLPGISGQVRPGYTIPKSPLHQVQQCSVSLTPISDKDFPSLPLSPSTPSSTQSKGTRSRRKSDKMEGQDKDRRSMPENTDTDQTQVMQLSGGATSAGVDSAETSQTPLASFGQIDATTGYFRGNALELANSIDFNPEISERYGTTVARHARETGTSAEDSLEKYLINLHNHALCANAAVVAAYREAFRLDSGSAAQIKALMDSLEELRKENQELHSENVRLKQVAEACNASQAALEAELASKQESLDSFKQRHSETESRLNMISTENQSLQTELSDLRSRQVSMDQGDTIAGSSSQTSESGYFQSLQGHPSTWDNNVLMELYATLNVVSLEHPIKCAATEGPVAGIPDRFPLWTPSGYKWVEPGVSSYMRNIFVGDVQEMLRQWQAYFEKRG